MPFQIAQQPEADAALDQYPFAVLLGMQLDQQQTMEIAFMGGWKVLQRLGTLDTAAIANCNPDEWLALYSQTPAVHRFPKSMGAKAQALAQIIESDYRGDVTRLWNEASSGAELLTRLTALPGFGKQKAQIFIALLAKQMNVRPEGWESAAGDYALAGHRSVADVTGPASLIKVREYKQAKKAAAKG